VEVRRHDEQVKKFEVVFEKMHNQTANLGSTIEEHHQRAMKAEEEVKNKSDKSTQWKELYRKAKKQEEENLKEKLRETTTQLQLINDDLTEQKRANNEREYRLASTQEFLQTQTKTLRENMQNLLEEICSLEERCSDLRDQLEKQRKELAEARVTSTDMEKVQLQNLASGLRDQLVKALEDRDEYERQAKLASRETYTATNEILQNVETISRQKSDIENYLVQIQRLQEEIKKKENEINTIKLTLNQKGQLKNVIKAISCQS